MAVDPEIRVAVDRAFGAGEPAPSAEAEDLDPLTEMRRLAATTTDARVKAQLLRLLRDEEREAERTAKPVNPFAELSDDELMAGHAKTDAYLADLVSLIMPLKTSDALPDIPLFRGAVNRLLVDPEVRRRTADFDRRVEERARELAEKLAG